MSQTKAELLDGKSATVNLKNPATADNSTMNLVLQTGETDIAANDVIGKISFQAPDEGTGTDAILVAAGIQATSEGDFSSSANATKLEFMTGASEAATTKMTISSAGAVTIGATGTANTLGGIPFYRDANDSIYTHDVSGTQSTAEANTSYGVGALDAITTGDANTAIGNGTLSGNTTGANNIAIGKAAINAADAEDHNLAIGLNSMSGAVNGGEYNVAIGNYTLDALTSADNNVAIGYNAGGAITTGGTNTLVGYEAGKDMTTQTGCTFIGEQSGRANTASSNTALGRDTLYTNTNGQYNVAIGDGALTTMNDSGGTDEADFNVAIGYQACSNLTTGYKTNAIGYQAGNRGTTTNYNVLIGYACYGPQTGNGGNNLIGGASGGSSMTTAAYNNALGASSLASLTTGISNIAIGHDSGLVNTTGDYNIYIGYKTAAALVGADNTINIGMGDGINNFPGVSANHIRVGKRTAYIENNFSSNATWSHSSDERYKKDIADNTNCGLDFINELRPVTYKWKAQSELDTELPEYDKDKTEADYTEKNYGLIAQEVKAALDKLNITDFGGWKIDPTHKKNKQQISEQMFVFPLIKAIQELSAKVKALEDA